MKTVGSLIAGVGLLAALALGVIPTHVSVLGSSGSCGIPVFGVLQSGYGQDSFDTALRQQCKSQSTERLVAAVAIGFGATLIGGLIGGLGVVTSVVGSSSRRDEQRWQQPPPHYAYAPGPPPPPTVEPPVAYAAPTPEPDGSAPARSRRPGLPVVIALALLVLVVIASAAFLLGRAGRHTSPSASGYATESPEPIDTPTAPTDATESYSAAPTPTTGVGYGSIKIGMTVDELRRSDLVSPSTDWSSLFADSEGGCAMVSLTHRDGVAMVQPDTAQVAAIQFGDGMKTSRGIGLGSTAEDLTRAYPDHDWYTSGMDGGDQVRVNDDTQYFVGVGASGRVEQLILAADSQACFD